MQTLDKSGRFSMRRVVRETGLSADTLRAWEERYGLPEPQRSGAGHRLYSPYDIAVVQWMLQRKAEGIRPGQAARLFQDLVAGGEDPLAEAAGTSAEPVDQGQLGELQAHWLEACKQFDEPAVNRVLAQAFAQFPAPDVLQGVVVEGMEAIGQGWLEGRISVAQEHFATQVATRKVEQLIAALPPAMRQERILVACPPGERHALPALLMAYLVRQAGWQVIYLGADLPQDEVRTLLRRSPVDFAILAGSSLATAPAMADMLARLQGLGIASGYGGYVYSRNPALRELMPGRYLGEVLRQIAHALPSWLAEGPAAAATGHQPLDSFLSRFELQKGQIGRAMQTALAGGSADSAKLQDLIETFLDGVEAAAQLGEFALLDPERSWLAEYLRSSAPLHFSTEQFLAALGEAAHASLGEAAHDLQAWIVEPSSS